jgi:eukaryotic-like serine/threonine-protein kinase
MMIAGAAALDETFRERHIEPDERLLRRFLAGALEGDELLALEGRLDAETSLQKRLGELAREPPKMSFVLPLSEMGTTRLPTIAGPRVSRRSIERSLEIGDPIGEGGMGIVHLGTQHSVGRPVAIKTVKSSKAPTGNLLEEAFITGQLEHPNIVPIHDIVVGEDGRPMVVLKKIEGVAWSKLVDNPELIAERYGVWNAIEWHVGVLIQVCQALRFAHSRNIVHRDIKPENVMIGAFDEVYLLDWGLAISTDESDDRLPTLKTSHGVAGTPAYMAPEQFDKVPDRVGPHTDVYLVGAALFEAAVGKPPQVGETLKEIRDTIETRQEVFMPEGTSAEIVAIVNRAMAPAIEDRYPDIQALRADLEAFLRHRGSQDLAERADERASIMEAAQERRDEEVAESAFVEAAFGYRMALDTWSGNHQARERLRMLVDERVHKLLTLEAPRAARRALALMDAPDVALLEEVDRALERDDDHRAALDRLARDEDRTVGVGVRRVLVLALGSTWTALWSWVGWFPPDDPGPLLIGSVAYWLLGVVLVLRVRGEMLEVRLNSHMAWLVFAMLTAQLLWLGMGMLGHRPVADLLTTLLLLWGLTCGAAVVTIETRFVPTAVIYALGFVLSSYDAKWLPWSLTIGAAAVFATAMVINVTIARRLRESQQQEAPDSTIG